MNPADDNEPAKKRPLLEQWWGGFAALFILGAIVLLLLLANADGADLGISWNPNPAAENVAFYQCRVDEVWGFQSATGTTTGTSYTFTGLQRGVLYLITLVAANAAGVSLPATLDYTVPFRVRVTNQRSTDMKAWTDYQSQEFNVSSKEFYRQKIESVP